MKKVCLVGTVETISDGMKGVEVVVVGSIEEYCIRCRIVIVVDRQMIKLDNITLIVEGLNTAVPEGLSLLCAVA